MLLDERSGSRSTSMLRTAELTGRAVDLALGELCPLGWDRGLGIRG